MSGKKLRIWGMVVIGILLSFRLTLAQEPYVVGISMAITGRGSEIYAPVKDALDVYFKEVNAKGGINGHPVKIIFEDNAAEPSKAASDAKKLITQDKVILLMNASLSSTYAPMIQTAKRYNVPIFFAGAVCPNEVYPPNADDIQFCSSGFASKYDSRFAMSFIKEQAKEPVKLGLVSMNIPISRGEIDFAETLAGPLGFVVVEKEAIPPTTPDFIPFATKIKNAGANWVYSWAPWATQVKTFEALRKLGWKGKYLAFAHIQAEEELERLKDDDFFVFGANGLFADNTSTHQKIRNTAAKEKTIYPYTQLTEGWLAAMVLEEVLKKTSWPGTPEKVKAAMNQLNLDMKELRGGPLVWTPNNHFRTVNYYRAYKWSSNQKKVVHVKEWTPYTVK
ncbi:MAG: ABC transporter substrate-binding protein [Deltaproteobacteria bacterium]|nr:ABC transporter substrate-binding protein [Deltaproteobacteria bacterium]